jgi:UDP-N-acetylmuramoylalanine--D-glutamate ligase
VRFVNDSKATNPDSAERGLEAFPSARVILGGSRKGTPFDRLAARARETGVRRAYLIGETAGELADALEREGVPHVRAGDLASAVALAFGDARPGDVVLLSPACASFDQFANFEERGEAFRRLVEELRGST